MGVYDQFIWFGDSLTQQAWGGQEGGFGAGAAVQNCECGASFFFFHSLGLFDFVGLLIEKINLYETIMSKALLFVFYVR